MGKQRTKGPAVLQRQPVTLLRLTLPETENSLVELHDITSSAQNSSATNTKFHIRPVVTLATLPEML
jgi:hypothetical protein